MSKVIVMNETGGLILSAVDKSKKRNSQGLSTSDFRRILSDLRQRPPSQRAFLRKLLSRALATGAPTYFPVVNHAVPDPVHPS
jgi:hypothetical protein